MASVSANHPPLKPSCHRAVMGIVGFTALTLLVIGILSCLHQIPGQGLQEGIVMFGGAGVVVIIAVYLSLLQQSRQQAQAQRQREAAT